VQRAYKQTTRAVRRGDEPFVLSLRQAQARVRFAYRSTNGGARARSPFDTSGRTGWRPSRLRKRTMNQRFMRAAIAENDRLRTHLATLATITLSPAKTPCRIKP
jgi:hypothetical protein